MAVGMHFKERRVVLALSETPPPARHSIGNRHTLHTADWQMRCRAYILSAGRQAEAASAAGLT